jgi:hypothetical protein
MSVTNWLLLELDLDERGPVWKQKNDKKKTTKPIENVFLPKLVTCWHDLLKEFASFEELNGAERVLYTHSAYLCSKMNLFQKNCHRSLFLHHPPLCPHYLDSLLRPKHYEFYLG